MLYYYILLLNYLLKGEPSHPKLEMELLIQPVVMAVKLHHQQRVKVS